MWLIRAALEGAERDRHTLPAGEVIGEGGLEALGCISRLVQAHVVNQHTLWEDCLWGDRPAKIAANRHVQQHEERMVEYPLVRGYVGGRGAVVLDTVYVPANFVRLPFYRVSMKVIRDRVAKVVDAPKAVAARWPGPWMVPKISFAHGRHIPYSRSRGLRPVIWSMSVPRLQKAGHSPAPLGTLMRASMRP